MATRGWEDVTVQTLARMQRKDAPAVRVCTCGHEQREHHYGDADYRECLSQGCRCQMYRQSANPAAAVKPSKYRNQRCEVLGQMFDSKREGAEYLRLHAREQAGEIHNLRRQVSYPLMCPILQTPGMNAVFAHYIADFVYEEDGREHIIDAKGLRTQMYKLKKHCFELQNNKIIEEV